MTSVVRSKSRGNRINITFNERGQPIGDHSEEIMSYWGSSVRKRVPIIIKDWHAVEQSIKDSLFDDLVVCIVQ